MIALTTSASFNSTQTFRLDLDFLEPEDMTGTAVFLASDDSKLIHGETIVVDGGWSVW